MDIIEIFKKERYGISIKYSEFKELGWTKIDYFSYLQLCEKIRSCAIVFNSKEGINPKGITTFHISKYKNNKGGNSWIDVGYSVFYTAVEELIRFLETYSNRKFPSEKPDIEELMESCCNVFEMDGIFDTAIYDFAEDYRAKIEQYIKNYLQKESYKYHLTFDGSKVINLKDLDIRIRQVKDEISFLTNELENNKPEMFEDCDIDSPVTVQNWMRSQRNVTYKNQLDRELNSLLEIKRQRMRPIFSQSKNTLYVYGGKGIYCKRKGHDIVSVKCNIKLHTGETAVLDAEYCRNCNKYFIYQQSYHLYQRRFKFLPVIIRLVDDSKYTSMSNNYTSLNSYSPLSLMGYTVNSNRNISSWDRKQLLMCIIDNKILSKVEIIDYLEYFIHFNGAKYGNEGAVKKWQEDLEFVHSYNIDKQPQVDIDTIEKYQRISGKSNSHISTIENEIFFDNTDTYSNQCQVEFGLNETLGSEVQKEDFAEKHIGKSFHDQELGNGIVKGIIQKTNGVYFEIEFIDGPNRGKTKQFLATLCLKFGLIG